MHFLILTLVISISSFFQTPKKAERPLANASSIVVESTDGGKTWHDLSAGLPEKLSPYCIYADDRELLLGYERGLFRLSKSDQSQVWVKDPLVRDNITGIYPGKTGPFLRNLEKGFMQEIAHSGMWLPIYDNMVSEAVITVLETADGSILVGNAGGLYRSADSGKSWKNVYAKDMVTSITEKGNIIIAATFDGVLVSTDHGVHWKLALAEQGPIRHTTYIDGQFVAICSGKAQNDQGMGNEVDTENSVRVSRDGKTWKRMDENLAPKRFIFDTTNSQSVRSIRDIEKAGNYLFCSLSAGIYRSADHGKSWELVLAAPGDMLYEMTVSGKAIYAIKVINGC
ncbi:MAG: hypothetical protein IPN29_03110 [Saprospiraceae bacterium]|nr:hypothetical protein [Saprospiraceae bacterium]